MGKNKPERALLWIRMGQKEPSRPGRTIFVMDKSGRERATKTRGYELLWIRTGQQNFHARTNQKEPPRSRGYDLLQTRMGQKEPLITDKKRPERVSLWIRMGQKQPPRPAIRFGSDTNRPERATKTQWGNELIRIRLGQKEPLRPRREDTIC